MSKYNMTVPTYDQFIEPILRYLAQHPEGVYAKDAHEAAAVALNLSDADRDQLLSSGTQRTYKNRAGWAHDRLKRAGLSSTPKHAFWKPTATGLAFAKEHQQPLTDEAVQKLAMGFLGIKLKNQSLGNAAQISEPSASQAKTASIASPDDQLGQAVTELRQAAIADLLEILANVTPGFFETIVLDSLHRMGYGANRTDLQKVGGAGDAGIDGIISLDRLGMEKVYVQAKRWQQVVGRPELQAFYGALAGQKAKKGVFITTSAYTAQAKDFVKSVEGIVLVDGHRLAELMIEYELGITTRTIKIPKIDSDYFDEEAA
jgi:restriction system protein